MACRIDEIPKGAAFRWSFSVANLARHLDWLVEPRGDDRLVDFSTVALNDSSLGDS